MELYGLVNKVKGRDSTSIEDSDDGGSAETAICLLTGTVMRSGSPRRAYNRSVSGTLIFLNGLSNSRTYVFVF